MELRISIASYYCQEAASLDKVRGRATVNVGAFHETEDWRHGKKVLSALGAMAVPRRMPEELAHDLTLLRELEALLEDPLNTPDFLVGEDVPDDDLPELAVCLREEIQQLRGSVDEARRQVAALQNAGRGAAAATFNGTSRPPPAPRHAGLLAVCSDHSTGCYARSITLRLVTVQGSPFDVTVPGLPVGWTRTLGGETPRVHAHPSAAGAGREWRHR